MIDRTEKEHRTLSAEISTVLSDRTHTAVSDRIALRDAVCAYVTVERARGTTLESLLQTLKEMLRKAEQAAATASSATVRRDNALAQQLVDWCVEFHGKTKLATV